MNSELHTLKFKKIMRWKKEPILFIICFDLPEWQCHNKGKYRHHI